MPGGSLPGVSQQFGADASGYLSEVGKVIAANRELVASAGEVKRALGEVAALRGGAGGGSPGSGAALADEFRRQMEAARAYAQAAGEAEAATGALTAAQQADMAAVRSYGGVIADLADRQRALAAVTGAGTDVIAAHAEQVRGAAGAAGDLAAAQAEAGASARAWAADVAEGTRVLRESSAAAGVLSEAMGPSGGGGGGAYLAGSLGAVRDTAREATAAVTETAAAIGAVHAAAATTAAAGLGGSLTDIGRQLDQIALGAGYASYRDLMRASYGGSAAAAAGAAAARGGGAGGGGTAAAAALGSALGSGPGGGLSSGTLDLMDLLGSSQGYHAGVSLPLLLAALGSGSAVASMLSGRGGAILSGLGSGIGGALGAAGGSLAGFAGGATRGLFAGGATASTQWAGTASAIATWYPRIHWAMMLTNEVLATAGPAAIAALAGTAVGMEGGQTAFDRLTGVNAVGQSIGPSLGTTPGQYLGLGDALQKAQTKADPQVWELMGAALNSVKAGTDSASGGLGNFWQLGTNTIDMMDRFGAQVTLDFKHGLGQELSGAVQGGTQDLQQFGDVLGNVGDTFMHVIPSLPGVGSDLLSTLQFATKGLSDVTAIGTKTGLLGPVLALEAGSRYGPALVGGAASLIGRAGQGLTAAGAGTVGGFLGTAARQATAADVGATLNPATGAVVASEGELIGGTGVAGALGGLSALQVGGIAAAAYLTTKGLTYKTPGQQQAAAMTSQVGTDSFTSAYSDILSGIQKLAPVAVQAAPGKLSQTLSPLMEFGNAVKHGNLIEGINASMHLLTHTAAPSDQAAAQGGIAKLTQQYQELMSAGQQVAKTFGVSVAEGFTLADQAGLQLSTALGPGGKLNPVALTQIVNTQTGLQAMTGDIGSGVYNTGVNAIQVAKGLAGSQLSTLNTAYDQLVQNATQGTTAATGFSAGMQALSVLALPAAQKAPSAKTVRDLQAALGVSSTTAEGIAASGGTAKSVTSVAKALEGFTTPGAQSAWAAFSSASTSAPGMIQTVESMLDQLRTAQASGVLTQGQVSRGGMYEAAQLLPYARYSPAALSQVGLLGQEAGLGTAYNAHQTQAQNFTRISGAIDKAAGSAKQYNTIQNRMTEGMSNVSSQAENFSDVLNTDIANTMAGAAASMPKASAAMSAFSGALGSGKIDTGALKEVVSTLKGAGESSQSITLMIKDVASLHGISGSALSSLTRQLDQDLGIHVKVTPQVDTTALRDQVRSVASAHAAAVDYPAKVDTPHAPPPPHGGVVEYTTRVPRPVAPPAPMGGTVVYHSVVIGPGIAGIVGGGGARFMAQHGFRVPGHGSGDIVPALLEPGELVVPRGMVGAGAVDHLRGLIPGFASGGVAGDMMQATLARATGMIDSYEGGGGFSAQQFGQMSSTFLQAAQLARVMGSGAGFASGGIVPAGTLAGIKSQIDAEWQTLDALYSKENAATGAALTALKNQVGAFWSNVMDPLYAAEDKLTGKSPASGGSSSASSPAASAQTWQSVIRSAEKTLTGEGAPWAQFGREILNGLIDGVKKATPETAALAQSLVSKVTTEVSYAKSVASAAAQGTGYGSAGLLGTFGNLATPTTTAQGQPYQYYTDQQNAAAGGTLSVQQQMSDYLQAEKSFTADLGKLSKGGLNKSLQQQLLAAGPLQGDQMAQSILGGAGGAGGANKLWSQIGKASNALGIGGAEGVYGYGGVGASKSVKVGVHTDAAAAQSAIDAIHGKSVVISVKLDMSGGGGAGAGVSLTAAQVKQVVEQVQASLLQQAKRNRKTGLTLPGYGS